MILEFIQAGFSIPELSKILGLSSMAIRRRLKKMKTQLLREPTSLEKE
jgi:predicted ArsR family transcriptional regulator